MTEPARDENSEIQTKICRKRVRTLIVKRQVNDVNCALNGLVAEGPIDPGSKAGAVKVRPIFSTTKIHAPLVVCREVVFSGRGRRGCGADSLLEYRQEHGQKLLRRVVQFAVLACGHMALCLDLVHRRTMAEDLPVVLGVGEPAPLMAECVEHLFAETDLGSFLGEQCRAEARRAAVKCDLAGSGAVDQPEAGRRIADLGRVAPRPLRRFRKESTPVICTPVESFT